MIKHSLTNQLEHVYNTSYLMIKHSLSNQLEHVDNTFSD